MKWLRPLLGCAAAGLLSAAAPPSTVDFALPTYTPAYEPTNVDERGLWMEADESERVLRDSSLLLRDPKLMQYLHAVLCRTVGSDRCAGARIYLLEVPQFNASMAPNGTVRVWTGLLLRVQNEAELAAVLAHEFSHFELRHQLNGFKNARTTTDVTAWLSVLAGFTNTNVQSAQIALLGSVFQFSREQETQADLLSAKYLAHSPYRVSAAADVWGRQMAEANARAIDRGRKVVHRYSSGFLDSHPTNLARATYMRELAAAAGERGELRAAEYREAIRPILPRLLAAQIKSNDFGASQYLLDEISSVESWTGDLLFARGELYRQRANPRDLATASDLFRQAIAKGYADPAVHRELGLSLIRNGDELEGRAALRQYLALAPAASDQSVIRMLAGN